MDGVQGQGNGSRHAGTLHDERGALLRGPERAIEILQRANRLVAHAQDQVQGAQVRVGGRGADLVRIDLNTGATTRLASDASCIALDDSNVFWATQTDINVTPKVP